MKKDGTFMTLSKKERLQVDRLRAKLEKKIRFNFWYVKITSCIICS
jgi:small subunit ribosomal protein S2